MGKLVLTRRAGESILIGPDIEVTLVAFKGNQAKIAIEAPPNVAIVRNEIAHIPPKPRRSEGVAEHLADAGADPDGDFEAGAV